MQPLQIVDFRFRATAHNLSCVAALAFLTGVAANSALAQTCTFTVSPLAIYLDNSAQSATVNVTASAQTCSWTASSPGTFVSISAGSSGTGNGTVTLAVPLDTTSADRSESPTIAGQQVSVTQRFTAKTFTDVLPPDYFFDAVNLFSTKKITNGCGTGLYCPLEDVTRAQMAIFIVRAIEGGDNFTASQTPYFTDVPASAFGFNWIQKMFELGITSGCQANLYCPNDSVTRAQMAVFIIRARYGATTAFDYTQTPYFTDVPTGAFAFNSIQRMKEDNITSGCSATTYCPGNPVTRGDMAIFMMRGALRSTAPGDGAGDHPGFAVQRFRRPDCDGQHHRAEHQLRPRNNHREPDSGVYPRHNHCHESDNASGHRDRRVNSVIAAGIGLGQDQHGRSGCAERPRGNKFPAANIDINHRFAVNHGSRRGRNTTIHGTGRVFGSINAERDRASDMDGLTVDDRHGDLWRSGDRCRARNRNNHRRHRIDLRHGFANRGLSGFGQHHCPV